ncbi:MAG: response regulator [Herbaspirillum sp.]
MSPDAHRPQTATTSPEVLVVDDNPVTRYSTSRVLRAAGFRTREAAAGGDALEVVDGSVAAVVLDVHLPDIDGFEVCRRLRVRSDTARVPVINLSAAHVRDLDKVRGLDSGADAYMTHPVEPALLVATVQALVRVRTAEEGMRRSEARFRAIYNQALNGICLIDTEGRVVGANPAMLALLKRDEADVVGRALTDFACADWRTAISDYLLASREGVWHGEFPLEDSQGAPVHLEWNLSAHIEPGVVMAIATDISERVALTLQREQLLAREQAARASAERVSRSKDEFIAVLSHELRTPLNAILGWVHVLKRSDAPANLARGLEAIERNAKTQTRLISDILDVSRMDLGKLRLDFETVDPADLVGSAVSALSGSIRDKSLEVVLDVPDSLTPVTVDPARLQQIVWNLITNATKFSSAGGRIEVSLRQDAQALVLTVRDQGQGIRPEFLPYLFDRFTQSDSASNRHHGGLGLGLSIVKQLVELHGGTVRADSEGVGHGACFIVTVPNQPSMPRLAGTESDIDDDTDASTKHALGGLAVLVVDDDPEAREMLGIILGDHGALVSSVADYASALDAIGQARPDMLVSDIGMPGKDGYDLVRELRRREEGSGQRLPAVALTAFARPEDRELAFAAGFDAHSAKPLRPNELISVIAELSRRPLA